ISESESGDPLISEHPSTLPVHAPSPNFQYPRGIVMLSHTTESVGNRRSACDRCRRHKLRCEKGATGSCHRCEKAHAQCIMGPALRSGRPTQISNSPPLSIPVSSVSEGHVNPSLIADNTTQVSVRQLASFIAPLADQGYRTDPETHRLLSPANIDGLNEIWSHSFDAEELARLENEHMPISPPFAPPNEVVRKLADLQASILADLETVKYCRTADKCPEAIIAATSITAQNVLVGHMLDHSTALIDILNHVQPTRDDDVFELSCDTPTMITLVSCYVSSVRIYRTIFWCIVDSLPFLLGIQHPTPQLFPGMHVAGFKLEARVDLQVQILVNISEDMLRNIETRFGLSGNNIPKPGKAARLLQTMLEEEASEQPPLYTPRGHCKPLRELLVSLRDSKSFQTPHNFSAVLVSEAMSSTPPEGEGLSMMWWAARHPPADPTTSFAGQTVLITGANTGLGYEAALKFAALGASRIILGVRSLHKGEEARNQICKQTGYDASNIQLYQLDMSTFASVKAFAEAVAKEPRLDIAILNAGLLATSYHVSPEGYEMCLQVMVLSTALLGILLLPQLQRSAAISGSPSHLEFVGSILGRAVKADTFSRTDTKILNQVNQPDFFGFQKQYNVSKLLLFYVMDGLVETSSSSSVIINTVCPGACRTDLGRNFSDWLRIPLSIVQSVLARSAEEGARTYVSAVTLGPESHGQLWSADTFFNKGELVTSPQGKALQKKVWKEILEVLQPHLPS
ncbi:Short chain dehydrogenase yanD, partial [Penicillium rolfsii]